jgi:hypothetical protein
VLVDGAEASHVERFLRELQGNPQQSTTSGSSPRSRGATAHLSWAKRRLIPSGAMLSVTSPQGGSGPFWSAVRRGINQATGSCPSSRRCGTSGSTTGSTAEMITIRHGPKTLTGVS